MKDCSSPPPHTLFLVPVLLRLLRAGCSAPSAPSVGCAIVPSPSFSAAVHCSRLDSDFATSWVVEVESSSASDEPGAVGLVRSVGLDPILRPVPLAAPRVLCSRNVERSPVWFQILIASSA